MRQDHVWVFGPRTLLKVDIDVVGHRIRLKLKQLGLRERHGATVVGWV